LLPDFCAHKIAVATANLDPGTVVGPGMRVAVIFYKDTLGWVVFLKRMSLIAFLFLSSIIIYTYAPRGSVGRIFFWVSLVGTPIFIIITLCSIGLIQPIVRDGDRPGDGSAVPDPSTTFWIGWTLRRSSMKVAYNLGFRCFSYQYVYHEAIAQVKGKYCGGGSKITLDQLGSFIVPTLLDIEGEPVAAYQDVVDNTAVYLHQRSLVREYDARSFAAPQRGARNVVGV
jgi:hypothetical protein